MQVRRETIDINRNVQHDSSTKVKPKPFDCLLVAGCCTGHKPSLRHVGRWGNSQAKTSKSISNKWFLSFYEVLIMLKYAQVFLFRQFGFNQLFDSIKSRFYVMIYSWARDVQVKVTSEMLAVEPEGKPAWTNYLVWLLTYAVCLHYMKEVKSYYLCKDMSVWRPLNLLRQCKTW